VRLPVDAPEGAETARPVDERLARGGRPHGVDAADDDPVVAGGVLGLE